MEQAPQALATDTEIDGGLQNLYGYGTAQGTTINNGGVQEVAQATATNTNINVGGLQVVADLGTAITTIINGGTMDVQNGASTGSAPIIFANGGTLKLDAAETFTGSVADFRTPDRLDLADISFGSDTTSSFIEASNLLSGILSVTNNTDTLTATIKMVGLYTPNEFHLANDGFGGTVMTLYAHL